MFLLIEISIYTLGGIAMSLHKRMTVFRMVLLLMEMYQVALPCHCRKRRKGFLRGGANGNVLDGIAMPLCKDSRTVFKGGKAKCIRQY